MDQSTQVADKIRQDLELDAHDIEVLAYIQSNKFITTKVFNKKFLPTQCHVMAFLHLRKLVERGLLAKTQKLPNEETLFTLTRPALYHLQSLARILISPEIRSPHINPYEREHDKRVLQMRVQIESDPALEGLIWLSDYEMRCGVKMDWKRVLEKGRGWDLAGTKLHRFHQRTPDGYFETSIGGIPYALVLEYENTSYNREKIVAMVLNLNKDFPSAYRLLVSRDKDHAVRLAEGMSRYLMDPGSRGVWAFSFFDKVMSVPFTRVPWITLDGKYLPFVKDPILNKVTAATQPTEVKP